MSNFKEWLILSETQQNIYENASLASEYQKTIELVLKVYREIFTGDLFILKEEEEEEDSSVPDYDPFSGGEDAQPVEVRPVRMPGSTKRKSREKQPVQPQEDTRSKKEIIDEIRRLGWMTRWSAMFDRREKVAEIAKIFKDEWMPIVRELKKAVRSEYEWQKNTNNNSEFDARNLVADKFKDLIDIRGVAKMLSESTSRSPVHPALPASITRRMKEVIKNTSPLLLALGYASNEDFEVTNPDSIKLFARCIKAAAKETGNDPPKNNDTEVLKKDASARQKTRNDFFNELHNLIIDRAKTIERRTNVRVSVSTGKTSTTRNTAVYHGGWQDILNAAIMSVNKRLTERKVNKTKMKAIPWNEEITWLDPKTPPDLALNIIKKSALDIIRDEMADRNKSVGQSTKSEDPVTFFGGSSNRERHTIDPEDRSSTTGLSQYARDEEHKGIFAAFQTALSEINDSNPSFATVLCIWLNLDCSPPGVTVSDDAFSSLLTSAPESNVTLDPRSFLNKMGNVPSADEAKWNLTEKIVSLIGQGKYSGRADNPPNGPIDKSNKLWVSYKNAISGVKDDAIELLARRWVDIMIQNSHQHAAGQRSARSWNVSKYINAAFGPMIRSGQVVVEQQKIANPKEQELKVIFKDKKEVKKYYIINLKNRLLTVDYYFPNGTFAAQMLRANLPPLIPCEECGGSGVNCDACEEEGEVEDSRALKAIEQKILAALTTFKTAPK